MLHLLPGSLGLDLGVKLTDLTLSVLANKNAPSLVWGNSIFEIENCYHTLCQILVYISISSPIFYVPNDNISPRLVQMQCMIFVFQILGF
jgi:hypothetical protein